ncbi:MAG: DUF4124 domain-containing protein [Thiobacillus sp.]|nr:DUF4124 domain-containing protein [Thiobacillus sp.]
MRLPAFVLLTLMSLCPPIAAAQATLNKCIDAQGAVTYSNMPCSKTYEVHKIDIDPAPVPNRPRVEPAQGQPAKTVADKPLPGPAPATIQVETQRTTGKSAQHSSGKQCDTLSGKLGRVLDKMDQARRKGYTQDQMNKWNEEVHELERKKQQSGCF